MMGKPPVAVFSVKPDKDKVRFSIEIETFTGPVDVPLQWHCVTSELIDTYPLGEKFPQKKTKHKGGSKSNFVSNDCPVESDRNSTISMFLARGLANFLKLQVGSTTELDNNYEAWIRPRRRLDLCE